MVISPKELEALLKDGCGIDALDRVIGGYFLLAGYIPHQDHPDDRKRKIVIPVIVNPCERQELVDRYLKKGWKLSFHDGNIGPVVWCTLVETDYGRRKYIRALMEESGHKLSSWNSANGAALECRCNNPGCELVISFEESRFAQYRGNNYSVSGVIKCPMRSEED